MRVALVTPWQNAWIPYIRAAVEARGHEFAHYPSTDILRFPIAKPDLVIHGWAKGTPVEGAKNFYCLRRYELYSGDFQRVDWSKADGLICVNTWIEKRAAQVAACPITTIYNGTDPARWPLGPGDPRKIGMACHIHPKKNLPLALQILALLPDTHTLHIAGEVQDPCTAEYLNHLAKRVQRKVYLYGHIPHDQLDLWWSQMGFCLSTSISEGNPNNVIETMMKGITPVVHEWPGAKDQFPPGNLFHTVDEAVSIILDSAPHPQTYRSYASAKFGLANYDALLDFCGVTR